MNKKVKKIIKIPISDLSRFRYKDLQQMQKDIGKEVRKRMKQFRKGHISQGIPDEILSMKRGTSKEKMLHYIATSSVWLRKDTATTSGWRKARRNKRLGVELMMNKKFKNYEEFEKFAKFMDDMQEVAGEVWDKMSALAVKLWEVATRINLDTSMITENYEYWLDHMEKLEELKPYQVGQIKKDVASATSSDEAVSILGFESISKYYKRIEGKQRNGKGGKRK